MGCYAIKTKINLALTQGIYPPSNPAIQNMRADSRLIINNPTLLLVYKLTELLHFREEMIIADKLLLTKK